MASSVHAQTRSDFFLTVNFAMRSCLIRQPVHLVAYRKHSLRRNFHLRIDDVFFPVALRSRDIAGQAEILQRGKRDVVGASNARFKHAAAPDRNLLSVANVVDFFGPCEDRHPLCG